MLDTVFLQLITRGPFFHHPETRHLLTLIDDFIINIIVFFTIWQVNVCNNFLESFLRFLVCFSHSRSFLGLPLAILLLINRSLLQVLINRSLLQVLSKGLICLFALLNFTCSFHELVNVRLAHLMRRHEFFELVVRKELITIRF